MISSIVTQNNEARITLTVKGTNGVNAGISAVIDTGFTDELTLPKDWVDALALPQVNTFGITLADGSRIEAPIHDAVIIWVGQPRSVFVHCMEGDALVGMGLMKDFLLHLPVRIGAEFTLSAMD